MILICFAILVLGLSAYERRQTDGYHSSFYTSKDIAFNWGVKYMCGNV